MIFSPVQQILSMWNPFPTLLPGALGTWVLLCPGIIDSMACKSDLCAPFADSKWRNTCIIMMLMKSISLLLSLGFQITIVLWMLVLQWQAAYFPALHFTFKTESSEGFLAVHLCSLHQAVMLLSLLKLWTLAWDGLQHSQAAGDLLGSLKKGRLGLYLRELPI